MAYASIKYNGTSSLDLGLILEGEQTHASAEQDIEQVEVKGRDGVLLIDNKRLKPVNQAFPFIAMKAQTNNSIVHNIDDINEWLNAKGFHDFEKSWDPSFIYKATYLSTFELQEIYKYFGKLNLNFTFHPIKFFKSGLTSRTLRSGGNLNNPGNVMAEPIWKFTGSGNLTLTINGRRTELKDIQGELIYDLQNKMVYKGSYTSQWDKIVSYAGEYQKPVLDPGDNRISWTGPFSVSVQPYFGVKL